jgi:mRNA interferase MazF
MTTASKMYPTRVSCSFEDKKGLIVLDQIRTVDKTRLVKKMGQLNDETRKQVLATLAEMFAE